ncbi:GrxC Glutaredoxin and related proteins [uncultured Caudovirales phage]|uniref:GrxC Glutaredoxin and related proteins n=1 Tax=uncultured Caudovirales phage TaxID=2100421 RepID=A0A6J7WUG5_9CAUD|nr:GrxC Glutaredoxin and related proteins [uncultured Caudovirales phage]
MGFEFDGEDMNVMIYTKSGCPNCITAKRLLQAHGLQYEEMNLDDEFRMAEFNLLYPDVRQMPQIFINRQRVGGLAGLLSALKQMGMS